MKNLLLLLLAFCISFSTATAENYPFSVQVIGQGKPLIFIPGFACSGEVWKETVDKYRAKYACHVLTIAGFAGEKAVENPSLDAIVKGIAAYIQDQKMEKPLLIGHSIGGALSLWVAAEYPHLPGQVIVIDALPYLAAMQNPQAKPDPNADCLGMAKVMEQTDQQHFLLQQRATLSSMISESSRHEEVLQWAVQSDRKTLGLLYCQFWNTDLRVKIATITCPVQVLLEAYFVHAKPLIEAQYGQLKQAKLLYAEKGLHFIMYDDPKWYFSQLDALLNE
jgi:pimeloyl-ACP methyl ester carboxylesterase